MTAKIDHPNSKMKEVIAGLTTFFTMSYIVVVSPLIWSAPGTDVPLSGAVTATVLVAVIMTFIAGCYVKLPYALAPGMGLNAFIVYSLIIGEKIPWPTALGIIFWSSILFLIISVLPIRQKFVESLPENMKHALSCGIGAFLAFIGFKNLNLIVSSHDTVVQLGFIDAKVSLGLLGFLIAFFLFYKKKPYAFLVAILTVTLISLCLGYTKLPPSLFTAPDFSSIFFKLDLIGSLKFSFIPAILAVLITNLFDSISSIIGLASTAGFVDKDGNPIRLKQTLIVDSAASIAASLFGTSPATVFIESATGIQAGGRTGLTSLVVALCFLPCFFISPLIGIIPNYSTAPILIFVGILMMQNLKRIKYEGFDDLIPIFLTIALMPLTFSITYGVAGGVLSFVVIKLLCGKRKEITPILWVIAIVCLFSIITEKTTLLK